ncbi:hypothetical protein [Streptomyces sp. CH-036]|uniref:hypothetical protein n=1 Tax=Streptomyces sp. CH-036 TaxID=3406733 RepID=UPI003C7590CA
MLGLPRKIVAGSGWQNFTFSIANTSNRPMKSVNAWVMKGVYADEDDFTDLEYLLTLEWYDQNTDTWKAAEYGYGHEFDLPDLSPGARIDIELRIKTDPGTPTGSSGSVEVMGGYHDQNGVCGTTGGDDETAATGFDFDIVAPDNRTPAAAGQGAQQEPGTAISTDGATCPAPREQREPPLSLHPDSTVGTTTASARSTSLRVLHPSDLSSPLFHCL